MHNLKKHISNLLDFYQNIFICEVIGKKHIVFEIELKKTVCFLSGDGVVKQIFFDKIQDRHS